MMTIPEKLIDELGVKAFKTFGNETAFLLGTSDSLPNTPWDRDDIDYIACWPVSTQDCARGRRIDVYFELHERETWEQWRKTLEDWVKKNPDKTLFMQTDGLVEGAKKFDLESIQNSVPKYLRRYFTSSIAYMFAYAIQHGYKKLVLYGISLGSEEEEYSLQRSCAEAWLSYAMGKGIEVEIAQPASLFSSSYMYGYEGKKDVIIKLVQLKEGLNEALADLEQKKKAAETEYNIQRGGVMAIDRIINTFKR
jgi:hypothetical protein